MIINSFKILLSISASIDVVRLEKYLPILYWHSANESCCGDEANLYLNFIKSKLDYDVYIKPVQITYSSSFFLPDFVEKYSVHPFEQIQQVCASIRSDPKLTNGYNAIGLSQGGLLLRGLVQTCPYPPMRNLISLGGPQQGVHRFPRCETRFGMFCSMIQWTINKTIYSWLGQKIVAGTYWHDTDEVRYRDESTFLAIINNEKQYNTDYVINLSSLKRLILVKYEHEGAIVPKESSWFGYYDANGNEYPMEQTEVYKQNKLGLADMVAKGKLLRILSPSDHIELEPFWFERNIIPYFKEP